MIINGIGYSSGIINEFNKPAIKTVSSLSFKNREKPFSYSAIKTLFIPNKKMNEMEIIGRPVIIKSGNVDLNCWFIEPKPGKPTVLFCHGNALNITNTQPVARHLANHGNGVLMLEYEGYGQNKGTATKDSVCRNALDAAAFLNKEKKIPNNQIVLMGHSLGGMVAAKTAAMVPKNNPFKGLVLDSTTINAAEVIAYWIKTDKMIHVDEPVENYTKERIAKDLYDGNFSIENHIPNIPQKTKIFVIRSANDELIEPKIGKELEAAVKKSHPDTEVYREEVSFDSHLNFDCRMPAIINFINRIQKEN